MFDVKKIQKHDHTSINRYRQKVFTSNKYDLRDNIALFFWWVKLVKAVLLKYGSGPFKMCYGTFFKIKNNIFTFSDNLG